MLTAGLLAGTGSLLGGALGAVGSAVSGKYQLQATRETNKQNYKIWREQVDEQLAQWNRENEYNSPSAQRQRLEDAGYNPLSGADSGNSSPLTVPSAPTMSTPDPSAFQSPLLSLGNAIANGASAALNAAFASDSNKRANAVSIEQLKLLSQDYERNQKELPFIVPFLQEQYRQLGYQSNIDFLNYRYQASTLDNNIRMNQLQTDELSIKNASSLLSLQTQQIFAQYDNENALNQMLSTAQTYHNMVKAGLMTETQMRTELIKQVGLSLDNESKVVDNKIKAQTVNSVIRAINMANRYQAMVNQNSLYFEKDFSKWYNFDYQKSKYFDKFRNQDYKYRVGSYQSGQPGGMYYYQRAKNDGYWRSAFDTTSKMLGTAVGSYLGK